MARIFAAASRALSSSHSRLKSDLFGLVTPGLDNGSECERCGHEGEGDRDCVSEEFDCIDVHPVVNSLDCFASQGVVKSEI